MFYKIKIFSEILKENESSSPSLNHDEYFVQVSAQIMNALI